MTDQASSAGVPGEVFAAEKILKRRYKKVCLLASYIYKVNMVVKYQQKFVMYIWKHKKSANHYY